MDLIKYDMTDIWAVAGDVVAPDSSKVRAGWGVEVVPRQWWNWFENRQDNNIAYMLQKGFPEWDATTEYQINKSYVQRNGIVYKATATSVNSDPVALTSWVRAFADYSVATGALGSLTPASDRLPYFNGTNTAALTTLTPFARTVLAAVDDATIRTTINAQQSNVNLTSLSGVTAAVNGLPYFTGTTVMGITTLTAFGRSLIGAADAPTARTTLGLGNVSTLNVGTTTGTAAAGDDSRIVNALQKGNNLSDVTNAATARTNISAQTLNANLTSLSGLTLAANTLPYATGVNTLALATFTTLAQTLLAQATAKSMTNTINAVSYDSTTGSAALPAGTTAQRSANASGLLRFNTDTNRAEINNGSNWGSLGGATGGGNDAVFYNNDQAVNNNYTVATGQNAMSAGPIAIANGVTVTVSTGSVWTIV